MSDPISYEPLDHQLADLLEELAKEKHDTLRQWVLDLSKKTREGSIALACDTAPASVLLQTKVVGDASALKPVIFDNGYLYLYRYWLYQQQLAQQINERLQLCNEAIDKNTWKQRLDYYFSQDNDSEAINWQQIAAALALKTRLLIISGGPGTGKTTTITRILALLIEQNTQAEQPALRFSLAAPTGKAAMRMSEAIRDSIAREGDKLSKEIISQLPQDASTIHRLLGYIPNSTHFHFNKNNTLATDVVIIDEASMIDLALMSKLFAAIPATASVILLGDKDQLSSVETGSVFNDLCATADNHYSTATRAYLHAITGKSPQQTAASPASAIEDHIVCLQKSWRFDAQSGIGKLATAVNKGNFSTSVSVLEHADYPDVERVVSAELKRKQLSEPWQAYLQAIKSKADLDDIFTIFNQFRILTALRKGMNGCVYLNTQVEKQLSQQNKFNTGKRWYHGRPIMITANSYRTGLFNGDIGITLIDAQGQAKVWFQSKDGTKAISPVRLPQHETAWATTIHKSQGSEFDKVLMILPTEDTAVLTRQLIYTGITRAKQQLVLVANKQVLKLGIERETPQATQIQTALM
ncbi:MAG: exodeoxyribonuclease V subunit alpha [Aquificaceae bacterium]|nr:MAG: exodeoxyribonuclease V subunit alpha [Aquificaceae bacterium]